MHIQVLVFLFFEDKELMLALHLAHKRGSALIG